MEFVIENQHLKVTVKDKGAEITSVISKRSGIEYIWQADEKVWNRHAPILFPFVGRLK
ncbi:MAG TPA: aldose 1-epimerase family protein, partial [Trichococcus sp.]|nr:aldose 1-epimerase family protein [Trichococcus sp.]